MKELKEIRFNENNIQTFYVDQTNIYTIKDLCNNPALKDIDFDIIIDDGLHEFDANICFLKNSFHKLKQGGIYVIEDITTQSLTLYTNELNELKTEFNFDFEIKNNINRYNNWDNVLAIIYKK
jgi:SAM-dependent methyltransferase